MPLTGLLAKLSFKTVLLLLFLSLSQYNLNLNEGEVKDNLNCKRGNNAMLLEYVKSIAAPGVTFHTHFGHSDGCKAQFKSAQAFLWISKQQAETGTRVKWSFSCSCHGKDRVDSENGRAKHACR